VSADLVKRQAELQAELKRINADLAGLQKKLPASPDEELTQEAEEQLLADVGALDLTQEAMDISASAVSATSEKVSIFIDAHFHLDRAAKAMLAGQEGHWTDQVRTVA
jgi:hypothetical protein